jgi:replicative DNA helicase
MTKSTEIKENKQAYYEYRDSISNNYLEDYIKKTRGKGLRANISCIYADTHPAHKKGTDNKPSMGYDKTTKKYHCMTCDQWASLVDIAKYDNKLTNDTETITFLKNEYPAIELFKNDSTTINSVKPVQVIESVEINTSYDFTNFINESNAKVIDSPNHIKDKGIDPRYMIANYGLKRYLDRGLTEETIKRFKLAVADNGFNDVVKDYPNLKSNSNKADKYKLILPILDEQGNCNNFIAEIGNRKDVDDYNQKYKKPTSAGGLTTQLYNEYHLKTGKPNTIFIVEGIYDALSIEQMGYNAIALLTTGFTRLENLLKHYKPTTNLVIMLDNDTAGKQTTKNMLDMLHTLNMQNIKYIDSMDILDKYSNISKCKDANDMLLKNSKELKEFLAENYKIINANEDTDRIDNANISNLLDYFRTIEQQPLAKMVSTGFKELDNNFKGGLRTGFYVLGAVSNLGKTAFMLQLADQIARQGQPVLYFSLEMDKKELTARSIARTTYIQVGDKEDKKGYPIASTTFDILDNGKYDLYDKDKKDVIQISINIYDNTAKNMFIVSGRYKTKDISRRMTIDDIEKIAKDFIQYKEITPVIFIDYMQIIAPVDTKATDKQNMDEIVDRLKQISIDLDTPVIAISSYNRDNYNEPANVSAFKESGSIEYGADYILALQYKGIDEIYYDNAKNKSEVQKKREIYELIENLKLKSNQGEPIPIEFKMLKSRNSGKFNMVFKFKAKYGYFKEENINADVKNTNYSAKKQAREL